MKKNYSLQTPTNKSFIIKIFDFARKMLLLMLLVGIAGTGLAQKKKGKSGKPKKNQDITISSCIQDMGNGMYRVNFSYNNPNDKVIKVPRGHSKVVIKKKTKWGGRRHTKFAINRFQPGVVENAFFVEFYDKQFVQWTLKNPKGKTKKSKANSNSAMCPAPSVIIPVYGQEGGKSETPLGLELTALAEDNAGDNPSDIVYQINTDEEVLLEIVPEMGSVQNVINTLQNTFGRGYSTNAMTTDFVVDPLLIISEDLATIDVFFPISRLLELNSVVGINFIRPLYTPIRLVGLAETQGDGAMLTDLTRESYVVGREEDGTPIFVDGTGVKIGVISDSFDKQPFSPGQPSKATADVGNKDLPGTTGIGNPDYPTPVDVLKDYPYGVASDEGRAMLQLVHDVAPGAELAFSTGVLSPRDFTLAIQELAAADCDIIVDDITYPFEPFFGEGEISEAIREFTSSGDHFYFTSAGNFSNNGYQGLYNPSSGPPVTNIPALDDATAHVFDDATQDVFQQISVVPGTYMMVLQWAEGLASQDNNEGATTDLDIFLVDDDGNLIVGNNRINTNGDSAEVLVFQATGTGTANILITRSNASGPPTGSLPIRYIAFRTSSDAGASDGLQFLEYNQGAPTVSGHAMTPEAITVGAVDFRIAQNPSSQAFSSYAGILTNNQLLEVDISAPDGGETNVQSVGQDIDGNGKLNFFGTSAAAPHAAAAFALVLSAVPSWYPEGVLPIETGGTIADQVLQLFKSTAVPSGNAETAGIGLINANEAFKQIASQTAIITSLTIEEGKTPGVDPFEVTIAGKYFPEDPTVLFNEEGLEIQEGNTDTEIKALVGPFTGNPELTVFTNAKTDGSDGGKSNGLTFFPEGTIALNIIAENVEIEFGQSYEFTYSVEGLPEGVTYEDTGLPEIVFTSPAVAPYPDVNNYAIFPGFGEIELTQEQSDTYQINFIDGELIVNKKDLIIEPDPVTIVYGEAVNVQLNYFGVDEEVGEVPLESELYNLVKNAHAADFFEENTLILINKLRGVVNEQEILNLLNTGSWMSSERIIQNKLRGVVNGMNVIDLEVENFEYLLDPTTNKLRGVVNKLRGVVNGQNLLNNQIELFDPISNKLRGVVNGTGLLNENGFEAYNSIFAVVDFDDGATEEDPDRTIDKVYATNLLTGLDVTPIGDPSIIFPGAFLSNLSANFNITYISANITVNPVSLQVQTPNLSIDYGMNITTGAINDLIENCDCPGVVFGDFVYGEDEATVFPDGISYMLEVDGEELEVNEEGLILPAGSYFIKITNPQNYELDFGEAIGELTVINKVLTVSGNNNGEPYEILYGEPVSLDILDNLVIISGLDEGEFGTVFPEGIPYFLEEKLEDPEAEANTFELGEKINAGEYYVRINMPESNFEIVYDEVNPPVITVTKKELIFNADYFEKEYGDDITGGDISKFDNPSESNVPVIQGFVYEDNEDDVFGEVIPYVFLAIEGDATEISLGDRLEVGEYIIRIEASVIEELQNYTIFFEDEEEENNRLKITKATLNACIIDVELRDGEWLFPEDIVSQLTGYVFDEEVYFDTQENVFPEGIITYLVELANKEVLEVTEEGLLLGEGTYTIKIKDDELVNYLVQDGETCNGAGMVEVTQCGDALILDFSNYTYDEFFGYYRFEDVALGSGKDLDALVTIQTRGNINGFTVDQNSFTSGSDDRKQFRPSASFTITEAVPEPYVEFSITLVNGETNTPASNVGNLIAGILDVDGAMAYQEYVEINLPSEYTVEGGTQSTQLGVVENPDQGLLRINGYNDSYTAIFNGAPRVNVEMVYEDVSSLIYRVGAKGSFGNVPTRQYGIQFSCLTNFNSPVTTTVEEFGSLMAETAMENDCVFYNNPVGPLNNYILYLEPKDGVSGAANITLTNMSTFEVDVYSFDDGAEIAINMGSLNAGMYVVQTNIGNCQSDGFIVVKE